MTCGSFKITEKKRPPDDLHKRPNGRKPTNGVFSRNPAIVNSSCAEGRGGLAKAALHTNASLHEVKQDARTGYHDAG